MMDTFDSFDLICEFPHPAGAYAELLCYIRAVHEFLPHIGDQRTVRVKAQLKRADHPVTIGELESELESISRDSMIVLPRLVWGGVMVSIFAAFEHGIRSALKHWQVSVGHPTEFRVLPRNDFLHSAESYAKKHMNLPLFNNNWSREMLMDLKSFRNSFAHGSGLLSDLPKKLELAINNKDHPGVSLEIDDGQWVGNARSSVYYLKNSERVINEFGDRVLEKCLDYAKNRSNAQQPH